MGPGTTKVAGTKIGSRDRLIFFDFPRMAAILGKHRKIKNLSVATCTDGVKQTLKWTLPFIVKLQKGCRDA